MSVRVDSFASAALRHARDSMALSAPASSHRSVDQAWHLLGFGPECALKASLSEPWQSKAIGHQTTLLARAAEWILALDPGARRRSRLSVAGADFPGWKPDVRYEATGSASAADVRALAAQAAVFVSEAVAELWAAGDLSTASVRT